VPHAAVLRQHYKRTGKRNIVDKVIETDLDHTIRLEIPAEEVPLGGSVGWLSVGVEEGCLEVAIVDWLIVGAEDGCLEGAIVGWLVGSNVKEGCLVGENVRTGIALGDTEGTCEGNVESTWPRSNARTHPSVTSLNFLHALGRSGFSRSGSSLPPTKMRVPSPDMSTQPVPQLKSSSTRISASIDCPKGSQSLPSKRKTRASPLM